MDLEKSHQRFFPKSFPQKSVKKVPKTLPKASLKPSKIPLLSNITSSFYRRRLQKYFQTRKTFLARKTMDKVWYLQKWVRKCVFLLVKGNAPHLRHTTKKTRRFSWCSSLEWLPTRLWLAFPLSFIIFGKDFKTKSGSFERK